MVAILSSALAWPFRAESGVDSVADTTGKGSKFLAQFGADLVEDTLHGAELGPGATKAARIVHGSSTVAGANHQAAPALREVVPVAETRMRVSLLFGLQVFKFSLQRSEPRQILFSKPAARGASY